MSVQCKTTQYNIRLLQLSADIPYFPVTRTGHT